MSFDPASRPPNWEGFDANGDRVRVTVTLDGRPVVADGKGRALLILEADDIASFIKALRHVKDHVDYLNK